MNVLMISNAASFVQLAEIITNKHDDVHIYHYGANTKNNPIKNYYPTFVNLPYQKKAEDQISTILNDLKYQKIDLILASGLEPIGSKVLQEHIKNTGTPHLFPSPDLTSLESKRTLTKKMLEKIGVPFSKYKEVTGWELFRDYFKIPKPLVIKLEDKFFHGRQTIIVNSANEEEVFNNLFSLVLKKGINPYNITFDDKIILEEFIDIDYEISYHAILNKEFWSYLGSARDYKKQYDGDSGDLGDSAGSYFIKDVDNKIHRYVEKIHQYLNSINRPYHGIIFLGIAVAKDGTPYVLEINTRPGNPEIVPIALGTDNFFKLFIEAANNEKISTPDILNIDALSVSINNRDTNWNNIATDLPLIKGVPKDCMFSLDGFLPCQTRHSLVSAIGASKEEASKKILSFLNQQYLGQFYYRKDIGLLK